MKNTQLPLSATTRAFTASLASICRHAASCVHPLPALVLTLGTFSGAIACAQTAHVSQTQVVLSPSNVLYNSQGLAVDSEGNLYVANQGSGHVLKLTPSGGGFIQTSIGTGLLYPYGVAVDANNNVYIADLSLSTLLKETPNGSGGYTQTTIGSGLNNAVAVAVDKFGNVYGIVSNSNFVDTPFKETLSGGVYTQSFLPAPGTHGASGVAVDGNGDLFLNDTYDGKVFEDIPLPGGGYSTTLLPYIANSLAVDSNNNLYVAYYPGTIYKLTPDGSGGFSGTGIPTDASLNDNDFYAINYGVDYFEAAALAVDGNGDVFFVDGYTWELIEESMSSSANFGQMTVTSTSYPVSLFFTFDTSGTSESYSIVTDGAPNTEYTDSFLGSCAPSESYPAGYTCDVDVYFTPAAPGVRPGAVTFNDNSGTPFATAYMQGVGVGPMVAFPGAAPAMYSGGLSAPFGTTVDAGGNVIVANSGAKNVLLIAPGGAQSPVGSGFVNPTGVAEDGAGNIFVADSGSIYEIVKATGVQTQLNISGLTDPHDLAVDGAGNLYISEPNSSTVVKFTPAGVQTSVGANLNSPRGIAVDANGNVYIADYAAGSVFIVPPSGTQSALTGFGGPTGVTVDPAGNVYVAVYGSGEVVEVAAGGARTTLASGLSDPYSVALDANGNVYFTTSVSGAVEKIDRVDPPSLTFAGTQEGTASADSPQTVTLANDGNYTLDLPVPTSGDNPSIAPNFTLGSSGPPDCPLVTTSSTVSGTLSAGASCSLPISFVPTSDGSITGTLTLTDNNLAPTASTFVTQSIGLQGTGEGAPAVSLSATSLSFGNQKVGTQSASQSVTLTNTGGAALTISSVTVTGADASSFIFGSTCGSSVAAGASCTIHGHFTPTTTGSLSACGRHHHRQRSQFTAIDHAQRSHPDIGGGVLICHQHYFRKPGAGNNELITVGDIDQYRRIGIDHFQRHRDRRRCVLIHIRQHLRKQRGGWSKLHHPCTIHGHFTPTTTGSLSAAVTITDNASGSPQSIALSGTSPTPAAVSLSATNISFGNQKVGTESASQSVTLTNTGGSALTITSVAVKGADASSFVFGSTCGASVVAGGSCSIHGHFAPTVTGPLSASVTITDNASGSPQSISLSGTGQ
ncbi:MAG: choice-of-anchor D domain-containing protein [Terracidiphilus sp.]